MTTSRTWSCFTSWQFYIHPVVGRNIKYRYLISSSSLAETAENDHLACFFINYCSVFISVRNLVTSRLYLRPTHRFQIKIVQLSCVNDFIVIKLLLLVVITSKQVHIVFVDNRSMVSKFVRDSCCIASWLNLLPAKVLLSISFFSIKVLKIVQIKLP